MKTNSLAWESRTTGGALGRLEIYEFRKAAASGPERGQTVFIGGKVKKWRGSWCVDVPSVLRLVEEARDGVLRRANYAKNLLGWHERR